MCIYIDIYTHLPLFVYTNRRLSIFYLFESEIERDPPSGLLKKDWIERGGFFSFSGRAAAFFQRSSSNGTLVEACSVQASWVSVKNSSDIRCRWHYFGTLGRLWSALGVATAIDLTFRSTAFLPPSSLFFPLFDFSGEIIKARRLQTRPTRPLDARYHR